MSARTGTTSSASGIDRIVRFLSCPLCRSALARVSAVLTCENGHSFDIARQGYVALFDGRRRANTGDDARMVAARERFLSRGHYAPIADALVTAVTAAAERDAGTGASKPASETGLVLDLAGGTGYYLGRVLDDDDLRIGISIDLSATASRRAARAHERAAAVAADVWQRLPMTNRSCSAVLSVFGPRNGAEIRRVLRDDGALIVVSPTARHLQELVAPLNLIAVDPRKQERLEARLAGLTRLRTTAVQYRRKMTREDVADEVAMGPSAHHVNGDRLSHGLAAMPDPVDVTVSVEVSTWGVSPVRLHDRAHESHNGSA